MRGGHNIKRPHAVFLRHFSLTLPGFVVGVVSKLALQQGVRRDTLENDGETPSVHEVMGANHCTANKVRFVICAPCLVVLNMVLPECRTRLPRTVAKASLSSSVHIRATFSRCILAPAHDHRAREGHARNNAGRFVSGVVILCVQEFCHPQDFL